MLVVADHQVVSRHYDSSRGTSKEKKAHEYPLAGQRIELVAGQRALEMLTLQVQIEERGEPSEAPLQEAVELPVQESTPIEIPKPPAPEPPSVEPDSVIVDGPSDLPVPNYHQPQLPKLPKLSRPGSDDRIKRKPRFKNPAPIIRPVSWGLVGVSALLVFLFLLGATGAAFSDPEFTVRIWILAVAIMTPILAAPGLLGRYSLRRYPAKK